MLAIGIRYLCGWSMAAHPADRTQAEWPPHPDRVFMALAAAHFETQDQPNDNAAENPETRDERETLQWLESLTDAPRITASTARFRSIPTYYVAVNDTALPQVREGKAPSPDQIKQGVSLLPERRNRQPRHFPVAIPDEEAVYLHWHDVEVSDRRRDVLQRLCEKVTYLGHSASLVQMWVEDDPPQPTLVPTEGEAVHRLRVTGAGRLNDLSDRYRAELRPASAPWQGYAVARSKEDTQVVVSSVFEADFLVFRQANSSATDEGRLRRVGLESTLRLTKTFRDTILATLNKGGIAIPEWVSGHRPDGSPSRDTPHLGIVPLAHVGSEFADGHLLGLGLVVPRELDAKERGRLLRHLLFDEHNVPHKYLLKMGRCGVWNIVFAGGEELPFSLRPRTWTRPSQTWATVTPIVLDRYPKRRGERREKEIDDTVALACERVGLPKPEVVECMPVSRFLGSLHARQFPALASKYGKPPRMQVHAVLHFKEKIEGPVLLGAGRYRGYGLCRPLGSSHRNNGGDAS